MSTYSRAVASADVGLRSPKPASVLVFFTLSIFLFQSFAPVVLAEDVSPYATQIQFLNDKKILRNASEFHPNQKITRAQFAGWMLTAEGVLPGENGSIKKAPFTDVPALSLDAPYVYRLLNAGAIFLPADKQFHPNAPIVLSDALQMLFFMEGIPTPKIFPDTEWPFPYLSKKASYAPTIHIAAKKKIIDATSRIFPAAALSQLQAADIIQKTLENGHIPVFTIDLENAAKNGTLGQNPKFSLMNDIYQRIQNSYLHKDRLNNDDLIYASIEGLVKSLGDTHTEFTKPSQDSVVNTLSGEIEGIGAVIQATADGKILVVSPVRKSPAEAGGVLPNDIILEVDSIAVTGMSVTDVASKIRGPAGTEVNLKIQRGDQIFTLKLVRAKVHVSATDVTFTSENIAVVTINTFGSSLNIEFLKVLAEINKNHPRGIVLDLRNNPGGYLDVAVTIAGFFIEQGQVVAKIRYPDRVEEQVSQGSGILKKYPVRVLLNKGSASASEILAGALQDFGVAKVIGEQSFGKGTVQELTTYNDGSTFKVTVAEWLTPRGRSIEKIGITPDITVGRTDDDIRNHRDPQLDQALQELR